MNSFTESEIEIFSLDELKSIGFSYVAGPSIAPDGEAAQLYLSAESKAEYDSIEKRASYSDVILKHTLEFAITHLNRRGTALLRYVTGDLVTLSGEVCPHCGRPGERLIPTEGSSYAIRTKDLIKVKGTLINPAVIMEVLASKPQIEEYQVIVTKQDPRDPYSQDRMVIRVATQIPERNALANQIINEIKNVSEVKPEIEFAEAKEIYNAEVVTKAIRFVDQRRKVT